MAQQIDELNVFEYDRWRRHRPSDRLAPLCSENRHTIGCTEMPNSNHITRRHFQLFSVDWCVTFIENIIQYSLRCGMASRQAESCSSDFTREFVLASTVLHCTCTFTWKINWRWRCQSYICSGPFTLFRIELVVPCVTSYRNLICATMKYYYRPIRVNMRHSVYIPYAPFRN